MRTKVKEMLKKGKRGQKKTDWEIISLNHLCEDLKKDMSSLTKEKVILKKKSRGPYSKTPLLAGLQAEHPKKWGRRRGSKSCC